jgi:elongation factor P
MKVSANSLRLGNMLKHKDKLYVIAKNPEHIKPGKGGAYIQVEMKGLQNGTKLNTRFHSNEDIERVRLDQKEYQYLYADDDFLHLMDTESFEQTQLDKSLLKNKISYLQEEMKIMVESYEDKVIRIELPDTVVLQVKETEPTVKGQTAASSYKPAILENELRIMVPPFVNVGNKIVVKTEDDSYVEKYK